MTLAVRISRPPHRRRWYRIGMHPEEVLLRVRLDDAIRDNAAALKYHRLELGRANSVWHLHYHEEGERCARRVLNELVALRDGRYPKERES